VFNSSDGYRDLPVTVPCGRCIGCRLDRSREWAIRCMHEASLHEFNSFITLTYAPENLPLHGSLVKEHYQRFMKRLRKGTKAKIRYYQCGEYGENLQRPHYHACLFGYDFADKTKWSYNETTKDTLYISAELSSYWRYGYSTVGSVTLQSAGYVARYITKKILGEKAEQHYEYHCPETGEIHPIQPEYTTMSRRPGIGHGWYQKYKHEVFPDDFVIVQGKKAPVPKYYAGIYSGADPEGYAVLKGKRVRASTKASANSTPDRLAVRETVKLAQVTKLNRTYEGH